MDARHLLLALGLLSTIACAPADDTTDSTEDEYRVKPNGTSILGTLTIDVPDGLGPGQGRSLLVTASSATTTTLELPSTKLPPGTYCITVQSAVNVVDRLTTRDCGITITGGQTTSYRLSKVSTTSAQVAFLASQHGINGSIGGITLGGGPGVSGQIMTLTGPVSLAATKSEIAATAALNPSFAWAPVTTSVPKGGEAILGLPSQDKIVRVKFAAEKAELPDAVPGGGMRWWWEGAPNGFARYATPRPASAATGDEAAFFATPGTSVVVELGGQTKRFSLDAPKSYAAYAYRIDVDPVTDTDNFGKAGTFPGIVSLTTSSGELVGWTGADGSRITSFRTGHGVWVWAGTYDLTVAYTANGVSKTYRETVKVP